MSCFNSLYTAKHNESDLEGKMSSDKGRQSATAFCGSVGLLWLGCGLSMTVSAEQITVFAAASLTNALSEIAKQYEATHPADHIRLSFASSAILARQIEQGAPAQIFVSADQKWMQYLQQKNQLDAQSRLNLLGNQLVLIAPTGAVQTASLRPNAAWAIGYRGRLCMGSPDSAVPAGLYAKQAFTSLKLWDALKNRVVGTEDVRSALAFVERAECDLGVVYRTDAMISKKVKVVATFTSTSHDPIVYPAALMPKATVATRQFFQYLNSPAAGQVFTRHGFVFKPQ